VRGVVPVTGTSEEGALRSMDRILENELRFFGRRRRTGFPGRSEKMPRKKTRQGVDERAREIASDDLRRGSGVICRSSCTTTTTRTIAAQDESSPAFFFRATGLKDGTEKGGDRERDQPTSQPASQPHQREQTSIMRRRARGVQATILLRRAAGWFEGKHEGELTD